MMHDGSMMDSGHMGWMMGGMGLIALLVFAVLVLGLLGLVKCLRN